MEEIQLLAIQAYAKVCNEGTPVLGKDGRLYSGLIYQQPSLSCSTVGRKYVHLCNCNGEIARYVIKTGEITI